MAREEAPSGRRVGWRRLKLPGAPAEGRFLLALTVIVLLGWGLRLVFWWQQSRYPVVPPASDEEEYYRGAVHIYKQLSYYDGGQWLRAPGPSALLALCFALAGGIHLPTALLLQGLISGLAVIPVAATARSYFGSNRAGLFAGLLVALYLPFALSATQIMSEPAAILTAAVCLWSLERWRATNRPGSLLWAGMALGLFTLTRAVGLYAQLVLPLWIWWRVRDGRRWFRSTALFLLGFWLLVAPWSIRNTLVFGKPVLVDTNSAFSFWSGTEEPNGHLAQQELWNRTVPNLADRQAQQYARAFANIRRDPLAFVRAVPGKIIALWQLRVRVLIGNGVYSLVPAVTSVPLTLFGDLVYIVIWLSMIACLVYVPQQNANWLLIGWPVYGTVLAAGSLGHPRLRIPFEVALVILAAYPLAHPRLVWQRIQNAGRRRNAMTGGALLTLALLLYAGVYVRFVRGELDLAMADVWAALGQRQRSLQATNAAVRAAPGVALPLIAQAQQQTSWDLPGAPATWQAVLAIDPHILPARVALLQIALGAEDAESIRRQIVAIHDLQLDDDRVYTALWERAERQPRFNVEVGTPADLGLIRGVSPPQTAGVPFRWALGPVLLRLPPGGATMLHLQAHGRQASQQLGIRMGGQIIGSCLLPTAWTECAVPLPAQTTPRVVMLESAVDVPWPPEDYQPRGVALARFWVAP